MKQTLNIRSGRALAGFDEDTPFIQIAEGLLSRIFDASFSLKDSPFDLDDTCRPTSSTRSINDITPMMTSACSEFTLILTFVFSFLFFFTLN